VKAVFIDTDCGVDDAVAIGIALAAPGLKVAGVSTVNGNVGLEQVTANVVRLLPLFGRGDIPVFRGADTPLVAEPCHAAGVHGNNGLGNIRLPDFRKAAQEQGAAEGLLQTARANPGLILVALGPLTNVAVALKRYPELERLIGQIVSMGGAVGPGNVTPYAEFNYYADPESVQVVLDGKVALTAVTWDAALEAAHSEQQLLALGLGECAAGRLFLEMHQVFFTHIERISGSRKAMLPDPLAMAYVVDPSLAVRVVEADLRIEASDSPRRGAIAAVPGKRARLVTQIDKGAFQRVLLGIGSLSLRGNEEINSR